MLALQPLISAPKSLVSLVFLTKKDSNMLIHNNNTSFFKISLLACLAAIAAALPQDRALAHAEHGAHESAPENGAAIGGAFTLTDQHGKQVSDADFRGKVMLVFFGFTHCPDICPVTVATLSNVMKELGGAADKVAPVFITVDPRRDTSQAMKAYLANFDPRIAGLSGTPKAIKQAASAYKVYFSETGGADKKPGEDYMVNHSSIVYMMGTDGSYARHFSYDAPASEIVAAIKGYLK